MVKHGDSLLTKALDKLTAELEKWRENASCIKIRASKTLLTSSLNIEVTLKEEDKLETIRRVMVEANKGLMVNVSGENAEGDEKKTVEVTVRSQGEDITSLGYHG